jgi:hypothetical protein
MECGFIEERLSDYIERSLPHETMVRVAEHLQECPRCSRVMEEMRFILVTCKAFPIMEMDTALLDRILLRTSGRPRTRPLRERFRSYFLQPVLTPRFATSVGLILLFTALMVDLLAPRASVLATVLSPRELFGRMDRGVQQIYSEGLRLYTSKNELQEQFTSYKNNVLGKLGIMIEQLDVPIEGKKKATEPKQPEKSPKQKSSAAALSLIPGMGAVYNGEYQKAITQFAIFAALVIMGDNVNGVFGFGAFVFLVFTMFDSFRVAEAHLRTRLMSGQLNQSPAKDRTVAAWGVILIVLGILFLAKNFIRYDFLHRMWPLAFIALGAYIVYRALRDRSEESAAKNTTSLSEPKE